MASPIQEYLIGLGFKLDDLGAKRFNETVEGLGKNFLSLGEQAKASAYSVGIAVDKMVSNYEQLYYLSQRTGATVQSLQATAFGFSQVGLQASDAKGMIDALALSLKFNPGTNTILSMLHVGPGDTNTRAMGALHALRDLNNPILQRGFGEQLGMNEYELSMLLAPGALEKIESSGKNLKRRQNEAGFDPDKLAKNSVEFENSMRLLQDELGIVGDRIKADLIGPMKSFVDLLEKNTETWAKLLGTKGAVVDPAGILPAIGNAWNAVGHFLGGNIGFGLSSVNTMTGGEDSPAGRQRPAAAGVTGQAGWWTQARQQHAIAALVAGGVSPLGAAALVSRWMNVESAGGPGSMNPTSGALGIGQWLGARKPGIDGDTNFDDQLAYVLRELHSSEGGALGTLNSATTPWDAARGASMYERAHGYNSALGTDDFTGRTAAGITIGAPQTTFNVHGGADPQTTADYVLKGQSGVWDDVLRNAGNTVR